MWASRRINLLADEGDAQGGKGGAGGVEDDEGIIKTREQGGATPSVLGCD